MIVAETVRQARAWAEARRREGARLALVPTMGALHAGHLAHVAVCRAEADAVALSVFVNPTQFGAGEDFERYPRDLARDARLAAEAGVDLLFAPSVEEMYPGGPHVAVDPGPLGHVLEGAARPGHFRGVATVVCKLLHVLQPDLATFGQKDAQQLLVVRRVVRELLLPVEIRTVPTVREADGLAFSSRNAYLTPRERGAAPVLYRALGRAQAALAAGERRGEALAAAMRAEVAREPLVQLDYAVAVDPASLTPLERVEQRVLLLIAARVGGARLIDNACLRLEAAGVRQEVL